MKWSAEQPREVQQLFKILKACENDQENDYYYYLLLLFLILARNNFRFMGKKKWWIRVKYNRMGQEHNFAICSQTNIIQERQWISNQSENVSSLESGDASYWK